MTLARARDIVSHRRRAFAYAFIAAFVASLVVAVIVKTQYAAQSSILMAAGGDHDAPADATSSTKPILSADLPFLATTPSVLAAVAGDIGEPKDPISLQSLQRRIKANLSAPPAGAFAQAPGAIVVVKFTAPSAEESIAGANAVASEMARFYRDRATFRFRLLTRDLQRQVDGRRRKVDGIERELQQLTATAPYLATKDDERSLSAEFQTLAAERAEVEATAKGDAAAAEVASRRPSEAADAARREITESDPAFHNVAAQFGTDYAQLTAVRAQYSRSYPGLPELEHTVARERVAVQDRKHTLLQLSPTLNPGYAAALGEANHAASVAAGDAAKLLAVGAALREMRSQLSASQSAAVRFNDLKRDRDVQTAAYSALSARLAEARADEAQAGSVGSVSVFDPAAYGKPVIYTTLPMRIVLAIVASLFIAFVAVWWIERTDYRLHSISIIETVYGAPIVATLN